MGGWINVETLLYAVAGGLLMLFIYQYGSWYGEKAIRNTADPCHFSRRCKKEGHDAICSDWNLAIHLCKGFPEFMLLEKMEVAKD